MSVLKKIRTVFISKRIFISMVVLLISMSTLIFANPSGEKTVSTVTLLGPTTGPATVTTTLTMFSEATIVGTTLANGTISGITFIKYAHNKNSYSDGLYNIQSNYWIEDGLKGEYRISNVKAKVTNSSSASVTIDARDNAIAVEVDDYFADDINREATVEIIGDLTYTTAVGELGKSMITAKHDMRPVLGAFKSATVTSPIEVNNAIVLSTQPLNFGNVIPLTGKYEKESPIDIVGARGTEVTISINGAIGQEVNDKLESGHNKIPITYRIENGSGNMISDLNLGSSGMGSAVLKGIINSDNIPRGQVGGSYTGSVTIEVDYK